MPTAGDKGTVELLAILLLGAVLAITLGFRRITRGMELLNGGLVAFQLLFLLILTVAIVPLDVWWKAIRGFVTPAMPPEGSTATELGSLAGFAAILSGFNWILLNHYRDKSYGMGYRVGFLTGLRGQKCEVRTPASRSPTTPPTPRCGSAGSGCCTWTCGGSSSPVPSSACCCRRR